MGNFDDKERGEPQAVVIEDKRHIRELDEMEESVPEAEEPQQVVPAEPFAPAAPIDAEAPGVSPDGRSASGEITSAASQGRDPSIAAVEDLPTEEELAAMQQAEYAYLVQIFKLGLPAYLRTQLGVLLNFALINLGRAANPATGLVTPDLDQAKLSIDAFEFILLRIQAALDPREAAEMGQLLGDMKYTFMQALGAGHAAAVGGEAEG